MSQLCALAQGRYVPREHQGVSGAAVRPRIGKNQVIHCLDAYQHHRGLQDVKAADSLSARIKACG